MKKSVVLYLSTISAILAIPALKADTIADWTFESSVLGSTSPSFAPGANTASTNFFAEAGTQAGTATAIGMHLGASVYTSPAGNGSAKSLSSTVWAVGDYYQFELSTIGLAGLNLSFDQVSSASGPGIFSLQYSLNGTTFTPIGSDYTVLVNASPNTWSATPANHITSTTYTPDLSSVQSLIDNQATLYFRLVDDSILSASQANGGTTVPSTSGTDRVDNFIVSTPEPSTMALTALGGIACWLGIRRRA
jgi:PEP-CTERM motif